MKQFSKIKLTFNFRKGLVTVRCDDYYYHGKDEFKAFEELFEYLEKPLNEEDKKAYEVDGLLTCIDLLDGDEELCDRYQCRFYE